MEHSTTTKNSLKVPALIVAAVLIVAGIVGGYFVGRGTSDSGADNASAITLSAVADRANATEHNDADVTFTEQMVPHHTQATEMTKLAETRASSTEVKALAAQIAAAQGPEIDKMNTWLADWGVGMSSDDSMAGMDHSSSMAGMMSDSDMTALAGMSGAEFDRAFLTMMTEHHTGAITMAETELRDGQNAEAVALASSIVITQQAEITQMKALLN